MNKNATFDSKQKNIWKIALMVSFIALSSLSPSSFARAADCEITDSSVELLFGSDPSSYNFFKAKNIHIVSDNFAVASDVIRLAVMVDEEAIELIDHFYDTIIAGGSARYTSVVALTRLITRRDGTKRFVPTIYEKASKSVDSEQRSDLVERAQEKAYNTAIKKLKRNFPSCDELNKE